MIMARKTGKGRSPDGDPARPAEMYMREGGWSEGFAHIAGFTPNGFPFGVTWEEMAESLFLANQRGQYLGRTCPWKECAPGIRAACEALTSTTIFM